MPERQRAESPPRRLRACMPCTKAKAKCNFKPENQARHLCDRCQHLDIECAAKTTKSIRKPRQLKPLASRVASLEQIIDNLTTRLASAEDPSSSGRYSNISTPESASTAPDATSDLHALPHSRGHVLPHSRSTITTTTTTAAAAAAAAAAAIAISSSNAATNNSTAAVAAAADAPMKPPFGLNWDQVNLAIMEFKTRYTPAFPFVVVPQKRIERLYADQPFLVRAVVFVTVPFTPTMLKSIRRELMTYLGMRTLVESTITLDVLQGMLILIAWGPIRLAAAQTHQIMHLAVAHSRSLGIVMPRVSMNLHTTSRGPEDPRQAMIAQTTSGLTMAQQRAYLGVFYLSEISSCRGGYQPLLNGRPLDVHAATRLLTSDIRSDFMVEKIVSIAEVTNQATAIFGIPYSRDRKPTYGAVIKCRAQPLRAQLDKIAQGVAADHPDFSHFHMHYTYALVRLYEPATFITDASQRTSSNIYHLQSLSDCLAALKDFFAAFVSIEPHAATGGFQTYATLATLEQVSLAACIAVRILLLEVDGWDPTMARMQLNFGGIMDSLLQLLRRADQARLQREARFAGVGREEDSWATAEDFGSLERYVKNLHLLRVWYDRRSAASEVQIVNPAVPQVGGVTGLSAGVVGASAGACVGAGAGAAGTGQDVMGSFELDLNGDWPAMIMGEWTMDSSFL